MSGGIRRPCHGGGAHGAAGPGGGAAPAAAPVLPGAPGQGGAALEADMLVSDPVLLDMANVESLDWLEPCGNANSRPLLYMEAAVVDTIAPIGGGRHLRLKVSKFGQTFDCVFFSRKKGRAGRVGRTGGGHGFRSADQRVSLSAKRTAGDHGPAVPREGEITGGAETGQPGERCGMNGGRTDRKCI